MLQNLANPGDIFGKWKILSVVYKPKKELANGRYQETKYLCECECGITREVLWKSLKNGTSKSCGCFQREKASQRISFDNLVGQKFNRLTVVSHSHKNGSGKHYWNCICDCGKEVVTSTDLLRRKKDGVKSCGCLRNEKVKEAYEKKAKENSLVGQKFTRLLVVELLPKKKRNNYYKCICDCGNEHIVEGIALKRGLVKSCGCLRWKTKESTINSYIGKKFNRLTVLKYKYSIKSLHIFECLCECGIIKDVKYTELKNGSTKSCGCYGRDLQALRKGPNHPSWNPNISDEERAKTKIKNRNTVEDLEFRAKVFQRDNRVCQVCKIKTKEINAHHIKGYKEFPDDRFDINNGITLCLKCHKVFHKTYGKSGNLSSQLEEFIKNYRDNNVQTTN